MIEFKIISTPDRAQQSTYQHSASSITMGNGEADMVIDDPQIAPVQIRIFFQGNQAMIENLTPEVEVRVNGRPILESTPLKAKDNLTMGRSTLSFSRLDLQPIAPPARYENPQASARFTEGSKEKAILDVLELLASQAEGSHAKSMPPPIPAASSPPPLPKGMPPLPPSKK